MKFKKIDINNWDRKEYYDWFTTKNCCKISMTTNIDVTNLVKQIKGKNLRYYPVFIYMISRIVNEYSECRMNYDKNGDLGIYDEIYPRYPIFHESDKKISLLWTEYSNDFRIFYDRVIRDMATYGEKRSVTAKGNFPDNCYDISSLPWSSFTSFTCQSTNDSLWLSPLVMIGRFFEDNGKLLMPIALSVHHAVCDGYHVSRFFENLQDLILDFNL